METRLYSGVPLSPVEAGLPYARSTLQVTRRWVDKKDLEEKGRPEVKEHTRNFISSLNIRGGGRENGDEQTDQCRQKRAAKSVREHWSVENKNHYKRDTCQWREDDHRHRRPKAAQNLALTRNALLAIIPYDEQTPLSAKLDEYQSYPNRALKLVRQAHPI